MTYVNYLGQKISLAYQGTAKKVKREQPAEYHNGWRVQGIPPGVLEEARSEHSKLVKAAQLQGTRMPKEWDDEAWLMNAKRKPVRGKPYEIPEAARQCKEMAERAGWLRVEIVELKKSKEPA